MRAALAKKRPQRIVEAVLFTMQDSTKQRRSVYSSRFPVSSSSPPALTPAFLVGSGLLCASYLSHAMLDLVYKSGQVIFRQRAMEAV